MMHGREFVNPLLTKLRETNIQVHTESLVLEINKDKKSFSVLRPGEKYEVKSNAAVLACGAREKSRAERGWITGSRPSDVFYTMNILDHSTRHKRVSWEHPVIFGSDLVAFSAAAKLAHNGAEHPIMLDNGKRKTNILKRFYFKSLTEPKWLGPSNHATIEGIGKITSISTDDRQLSCDGAIISGDLVANSELALLAGLKVNSLNRKPLLYNNQQLSELGWFAAGNVTGNIHGAYWCYLNGRLVARHIAGYLKTL